MPTFQVVTRKMLVGCLKELDLLVMELVKNPCKQLLGLFLLQFYELIQLSAICDINNLKDDEELKNPPVKASSIKKMFDAV